MNSATRLIKIVESIKETKDYSHSILKLFEESDKYTRIMFYKYFLNDINHIKYVMQDKKKYKDSHQNTLANIANFISPNFNEHHIPIYSTLLNDLSLMNFILEDEDLYLDDIILLKNQLEQIKPTGTILDNITQEITEAITYYEYFGNNIIEEKIEKINTILFVNRATLKLLINKHKATFSLIIQYYKFYKNIKNISTEFIALLDFAEEIIEDIEIIEK